MICLSVCVCWSHPTVTSFGGGVDSWGPKESWITWDAISPLEEALLAQMCLCHREIVHWRPTWACPRLGRCSMLFASRQHVVMRPLATVRVATFDTVIARSCMGCMHLLRIWQNVIALQVYYIAVNPYTKWHVQAYRQRSYCKYTYNYTPPRHHIISLYLSLVCKWLTLV